MRERTRHLSWSMASDGCIQRDSLAFPSEGLSPTFLEQSPDGGTGATEEQAVSQAQCSYLLFNFCQGLDGDSQEIKRLHLKTQTKLPFLMAAECPLSLTTSSCPSIPTHPPPHRNGHCVTQSLRAQGKSIKYMVG